MFTKLNYVHETWFLSEGDKGCLQVAAPWLYIHKNTHSQNSKDTKRIQNSPGGKTACSSSLGVEKRKPGVEKIDCTLGPPY